MRHFFTMGYLFVLALFVITGAFIAFGAPFNDKAAVTICFSGVYICFERLCKMCGVYE